MHATAVHGRYWGGGGMSDYCAVVGVGSKGFMTICGARVRV